MSADNNNAAVMNKHQSVQDQYDVNVTVVNFGSNLEPIMDLVQSSSLMLGMHGAVSLPSPSAPPPPPLPPYPCMTSRHSYGPIVFLADTGYLLSAQ